MSNNFLQYSNDKECQDLISKYEDENVSDVAIKLAKLERTKRNFILEQIKGRKKGKEKFPSLASFDQLIYPPYISIEQCSSEATALYKSKLFSGNHFIDLTAGFGVDDYYFSKSFKELILVEKDKNLSNIVSENFKNMDDKHVNVLNSSAEDFLERDVSTVDLIYVDPSRRIDSKKVFRIEDCEPNLIKILPILKNKSDRILLKLSPMMDLSEIRRSIKGISEIHIVSLSNECKEILVCMEKSKESDHVHCIDLGKNTASYTFSPNQEKDVSVEFSEPKQFIYLPNASITKAGAFNSISKDFDLNKISANTHVYTSDKLNKDFPGSIYQVKSNFAYKKDELQKATKQTSFNIIKRNFPYEIKDIVKKLKISDSGTDYLLAYRNKEEKPKLCLCSKVIV